MTRAGADTFRVAFVCTGNQFRSPLAAAAFRTELGSRHPGVVVESYAALGRAGQPALREAVELGARLGVDLRDHRSRTLERGELRGADLVVCFERSHVAAAVIHGDAARDRTYTLPALVALLEQCAPVPQAPDAIANARSLLEALSRERVHWGLPDRREELADPVGQPLRIQRQLAERTCDLTRLLAQRLLLREC